MFSLDVDLISVSMHVRSSEDNLCFHARNQNVKFGYLKYKKSPEICIFICMCMYIFKHFILFSWNLNFSLIKLMLS